MTENTLNALFGKHKRDAVLLYRPYPPHSAPRTNSKFGGLPRLPAHYEWPRDGKGAPLHFLAQVDCADIGFATPLPERGVLFFFAREDEEQIWNDGSWIRNAARVIYALDAFAATPPRVHPEDLGPVGGGYYPPSAWREVLQHEERGPSVHVEWPIAPLRIDTWPDALFEEPVTQAIGWRDRLKATLNKKAPPIDWQAFEARQQSYAEHHKMLRIAAYAKATGQAPVSGERPIFHEREVARRIYEHNIDGALAYPQYWIQVEYAMRAFICDFREGRTHPILDEAQLPTAREWLERSRLAGSESKVGSADRAAFRAYLIMLEKPSADRPPSKIPYGDFVFTSLLCQVRSWAGDPAKAALIAPHIYQEMQFHFAGNSVWGLQYSQMLGHAPSAQEPLHPDDPTLCLLNLASDAGLGWMFGDVGNAAFHISPDELAGQDFSKVKAEVAGH